LFDLKSEEGEGDLYSRWEKKRAKKKRGGGREKDITFINALRDSVLGRKKKSNCSSRRKERKSCGRSEVPKEEKERELAIIRKRKKD